ncbi:PREDICTED: uncharacterized protein LOC108565063 isoform X2 [Nicrophorus vespilloides]|uniref:Uncharacterized protein LOC108565063 isoform X2 n=1 Tax=Nicrophorus vespilloides TaxID=110193 RepID=A0ABM1MZ14_NICVS|nr:PREDICTED: uncharacterized protein LOC108565063 isoform X2 [Nicrophorus vespilloides]
MVRCKCVGPLQALVLFIGIIALTNGEQACQFPGAPAHSHVVFSSEEIANNTKASYVCERGFELLGPSERYCINGHWIPEGIPFCVLNVAVGKAPMQISTELDGMPHKAIDGSTTKNFTTDTCTLTKQENKPWWYVNLLEPYMVQLVRLDFGKSCCGAMNPATLVVRVGNNRPDLGSNPVCNRFTGELKEGEPLFLPCNPPMPGAFVSVHIEYPEVSQLSICEAFVYTDQALPIERCPQFRDQPPGSMATYNGKCYIFYNRPLKFTDALSFCRSRGGTLIDESNPALQGFISWELWRRHRNHSSGRYWMGAVRDKNIWTWLKQEEIGVSFWDNKNGNGQCARYDGTRGWLWVDTDCEMQLNFICQHQPKACGRPEQPPNSTMIAQNFNVGANVEYTCDEGHLLVGPTTRTCLDTGFYNEFPPVCKRIQCGYPADIANGEYTLLNNSIGYLSRVIYTCDKGYLMVGRAQLACDIDERWNGPPPRCEAITCRPPVEITNGSIKISNSAFIFGTIIEYSCNPGFKLIGSNVLTCLENGQYDVVPPTCQEEIITTTPTTTTTVTKTTRIPTKTRGRPTRPVPTTIRAETDIIRLEKTKRPAVTYRPTATTTERITSTTHTPPLILAADHPQDNEIAGSSNIQQGQTPNVNVPMSIDGREERREPFGAKLNLGAIIALGAFGGFIFLAAIITTIIILVRSAGSSRRRSSHRVAVGGRGGARGGGGGGTHGAMPSRWYTLLALPFPDQQIGRREFTRNYRTHRAGYFSNPI